jgi:hypothetical protein
MPVKQEPVVEPATSAEDNTVDDDFDLFMAEEKESIDSGMTQEEDVELPDRSDNPRNLEYDLMHDEIMAFRHCRDSEEDFIDTHLENFA